ncbi:SDR family NAD(P)-dependent oxidoreductase [Cellulomonas sp. P5_C5]
MSVQVATAPQPGFRADDLAGKVAVVTGATSGIGAATAEVLAARGVRLLLVGRDEERGEQVRRRVVEAGAEAVFVPLDLREAGAVDAGIQRAVDSWGRLDCAFNNAGVLGPGTVADADVDVYDEAFAVNTRGLWLCMRSQVALMGQGGGGSIVNNLSVHAVRTVFPGIAPYVASKAAALALTRSAAVELADQGIRVNGVAPGPVDTELFARSRALWAGADPWTPLLPMGRIGTPQEVADVVAWLFSDDSRYVTGNVVAVDGGFLAS